MSETTEDANSSATGSLSTIEADQYALPAFGYPEYNHGWVECNSKTFPGKSYYFNVDSCCSTWSRPVSRFVPTPLIRPLNLQSDEDFLDVAPIIVSDIEDEDDDYNNNSEIKIESPEKYEDVKPLAISGKEAREKKMFDEVLFKLYHCYGDEWNYGKTEEVAPFKQETSSCEYDHFDEDSNDDFSIILPEICYSSGSEDESSESSHVTCHNNSALSESFGSVCEFTLWERNGSETFLSPRAVVSKEGKSSGTLKSPSTALMKNWNSPKNVGTPRKVSSQENNNFEARGDRESFDEFPKGHCDLSNALNGLKVNNYDDSNTAKQDNVSANSTLSYKACRQLELTSDEEEEEDEDEIDDKNCVNNNFYALPKLKAIEFSDLLTEPLRNHSFQKSRKRKARDVKEKKRPPKKIIKTICVLNGITTVNYDYLTPELPDGVIMSNLSDSGSSTCYDAWQALQDNEKSEKNPQNNETSEVTKKLFLIHDSLDISDPYLSESSSSSCASVKSNRSEIKKRLGLRNASKSSDSESSDSSTSSSSSDSSASSKNNGKQIQKLPRVANKNVKNRSYSSSSSSLNSDKSWRNDGSSDDKDY